MLYKPHTPMELGDAMLGQLTNALVFVFDHMIPAVHNIISWETDDVNLGPIIPEWSGDARSINSKGKMLTTQPPALVA
ncbi:Methylenetetrahydrofolate dehydrogenase [Phytophthora palmivora]|uniref:Methylenetetrahydrofolate dehydrogenase n=1 Tax=Phytophthora palmivora TaxID=4796 RepID=A0A2P4YI26_9STRA|nr:Methylenetetrahydrofolate dehydrogenase [Phytophthora palmivora]